MKGCSVAVNRYECSPKWVTKGRQNAALPQFFFDLEQGLCSSCSGGQVVAMMQTAESWHRANVALGSGFVYGITTGRRSLSQCKMSSVVMVITDVLVHQAFQMPLVQDDHMVEQIAAAVSNPALGNAVLPRAAEAGSFGLDAEAFHRFDDFAVELRSAIKDQITRRRVVRECLAQLLNDPLACRMLGHVAVKDTPPVVRDDEETVENAEGQRRHSEEVHRGNRLAVVAQKSRPSFHWLRTPRRFSHPTQHGSLGNIEAEHLQLAVNA